MFRICASRTAIALCALGITPLVQAHGGHASGSSAKLDFAVHETAQANGVLDLDEA